MGGGCSSAKAIQVVVPTGDDQPADPVVIVKPAQGECLANVVTGHPAADAEQATAPPPAELQASEQQVPTQAAGPDVQTTPAQASEQHTPAPGDSVDAQPAPAEAASPPPVEPHTDEQQVVAQAASPNAQSAPAEAAAPVPIKPGSGEQQMLASAGCPDVQPAPAEAVAPPRLTNPDASDGQMAPASLAPAAGPDDAQPTSTEPRDSASDNCQRHRAVVQGLADAAEAASAVNPSAAAGLVKVAAAIAGALPGPDDAQPTSAEPMDSTSDNCQRHRVVVQGLADAAEAAAAVNPAAAAGLVKAAAAIA